jgi:hypothetical protein
VQAGLPAIAVYARPIPPQLYQSQGFVVFYACELHQATVEELSGAVSPQRESRSTCWRDRVAVAQRWLSKRIQSGDVLDRVAVWQCADPGRVLQGERAPRQRGGWR